MENVSIQTKNLTFRYQKGGQVFKFPDIHLGAGENLLILGQSGIGKTTLLHLLAGLLTPESGEIQINGTDIHRLSGRKMDRFRGSQMGFVFQGNLAVRSLSVLENLQTRLFFSQGPKPVHPLEDVLRRLDIDGCKHKKAGRISEGQLQRLGVAMAIVHQPRVILADEPTSSLDDAHCAAVMELLIGEARSGNANLVVITHDRRIQPYFKNSLVL